MIIALPLLMCEELSTVQITKLHITPSVDQVIAPKMLKKISRMYPIKKTNQCNEFSEKNNFIYESTDGWITVGGHVKFCITLFDV